MKADIALLKRQRRLALARILYSALDAGDDQVMVTTAFSMFPPDLRMYRLSQLHRFLYALPLTVESEGRGRSKRSTIRMDANALAYIADQLDKELPDLLKMVAPKDKPKGYMPLDEFIELRDSIPEFAPMGDPVFQLTSAPRV